MKIHEYQGKEVLKRYGVPVPRGTLRTAAFRMSPLAIAAQLSRGAFDAARIRREPHCLVYWADPDADRLRILEADELTASLLAHVDGTASIAEIVGRVAPGESALARALPVFGAAAETGLIALDGGG